MRQPAVPAILLLGLVLSRCAGAAEPAAPPDTTHLASLSPEELFVRASSSELQFAALVQPSRRLLIQRREESLPYLLSELDTDDVRERIALEDLLVRMGSPAVAPLVAAFDLEASRSDVTRGARLAATVLGRIGDPEAVGALVGAIRHADWKVRSAVAEALGLLGRAEAATSLVALLGDRNEIVRKSAAVALGRIAGKAPGPPRLDGAAIDALVTALDDPFFSVRFSAEGALVAVGEGVVPALVAVTERETGEARLLAIMAMGEIGSREAMGALRKLLASSEWAVRAWAAEAMGRIGLAGRDRTALERLLRADPHPFVVVKAREALAASD